MADGLGMDGCRVSAEASEVGPLGGSDWSVLMARAQNGDRSAYAALLAELVPYIRSLSRRYFSAEDEVEDSLQDVLLTVHGIRHTYDPARPFGPWIVTIARRRFADRMRWRARTLGREVSLAGHPEALSVPDGHHADLDRAVLHRAIRGLPLAQRRAVELLRLRELSLREASAESGIKQGALKVALHRAIQSLRDALAVR